MTAQETRIAEMRRLQKAAHVPYRKLPKGPMPLDPDEDQLDRVGRVLQQALREKRERERLEAEGPSPD